jgi:large conductance mechanosensitive channel
VLKGFRSFLMRGDIVVVAVGLAVALAFSALIAAFTTAIIKPIVARAQGGHSVGLGVQLGQSGNTATFVNFGALISALIYFLVFMMVVYFVIVVPYRHAQRRRGITAFGDAPPVKTCPACLSDDIPAAASKCKYCGTEQPQEEAQEATA